ncbi:hypothetical protein RIF29_10473 [Crotalaria pallida]|uniref:Uncharacterized protein n=1 Tax=Crotalaria pallida TaxID=3830 RepID=A0AAN9ILR5_CROPI
MNPRLCHDRNRKYARLRRSILNRDPIEILPWSSRDLEVPIVTNRHHARCDDVALPGEPRVVALPGEPSVVFTSLSCHQSP